MNDTVGNAETSTAATDVGDITDPAAANVTDSGTDTDPDARTDTDPDNDTDTASPASREAAKWRRKFREAEATIEKMTERLAVVQRGDAERIAAAHLADGADIWRDGADLDSVLDENGDVDPAKVAELAAATIAKHPHWKTRPLPPVIKRGGLNSGASSPSDRLQPSWASVLRGNR